MQINNNNNDAVYFTFYGNGKQLYDLISLSYGASCLHTSDLNIEEMADSTVNARHLLATITCTDAVSRGEIVNWLTAATTKSGNVSKTGRGLIPRIDPNNGLAKAVSEYLFAKGTRPNILVPE